MIRGMCGGPISALGFSYRHNTVMQYTPGFYYTIGPMKEEIGSQSNKWGIRVYNIAAYLGNAFVIPDNEYRILTRVAARKVSKHERVTRRSIHSYAEMILLFDGKAEMCRWRFRSDRSRLVEPIERIINGLADPIEFHANWDGVTVEKTEVVTLNG